MFLTPCTGSPTSEVGTVTIMPAGGPEVVLVAGWAPGLLPCTASSTPFSCQPTRPASAIAITTTALTSQDLGTRRAGDFGSSIVWSWPAPARCRPALSADAGPPGAPYCSQPGCNTGS